MQMNSKSNCHLVAVSPLSIAPASYTSNEVLSVLGGKASCRRKFVIYVQLLDDEGKEVAADMTLTASLAYAHDNSPVKFEEGQRLVEPLLFSTFNGVEFPAKTRPTQMVAGCATFKLAISLLSSKCDNRMFTVCFQATSPATPSEEKKDAASAVLVLPGACYSKPIRSISRKRSRGGGCESKVGRASSLPPPHADLCASLWRERVGRSESADVKVGSTIRKSENNSRPSSLPLRSQGVPPRSGNRIQEPHRVETEASRKLSRTGAPFRLQTLQILQNDGPSRLNPESEPMHTQVAPPMPGSRQDTLSCQGVHMTEIQRLSDASFATAGPDSHCAPHLFSQFATSPSGRPEAVPWPLSPLSARLPDPFCTSPATQAFFAACYTAPPVASTPLQVAPRNPPSYDTPESGVTNSRSPESVGEGAPKSHESLPLAIEEQTGSRNITGEAGRGGCDSIVQASADLRHGSIDMATPCCEIFQNVVGQDMQFSGPFGDLSCTYSPFSEFPSPCHVMISPRGGGAFVPFSPVSGQFSPVCRILPYYSKCETPNGLDEKPQSSLKDVPSRLGGLHAQNTPPPTSYDQIWDRHLPLNP